MIRADRELLADLARLNSDVVPLAMKMDDSVTREEQQTFADLFDLGKPVSIRPSPLHTKSRGARPTRPDRRAG